MRPAIYVRVSTEEQGREGYSINHQLERCLEEARHLKMPTPRVYVDDGKSARTINRPAYRQMMDEKDKWDVLMVLKMDRVHRNTRNFLEMMNNIRVWGKAFYSVNERFDTSTALGPAVMTLLSVIHEWEANEIADRTKAGMTQKAKSNGGIMGGNTPFGYVLADDTYRPLEPEATAVKWAFRSYAAGARKQKIVDHLNQQGLRGKRGSPFNTDTLTKMLSNARYAGAIVWADTMQFGHYEGLVDIGLFNKVQDRLAQENPRAQSFRLSAKATTSSTALPTQPGASGGSPPTSQTLDHD